MPAKFVVAVFGIITGEENRVLLGKDLSKKWWVLPGGRVESGEDLKEALIREIQEETGLKVEPVSLVGIYTRNPKPYIALVFNCKVLGGKLQPGPEMSEFGYFSEKALPQPLHRDLALRLSHYWHPPAKLPFITME